MTEQTPIARAFASWVHAEAAAHYATGRTDEAMDKLTGRCIDIYNYLMTLPASRPEDVLLKAFALIREIYCPGRGGSPFIPVAGSFDGDIAIVGIPSIVRDMQQLCPPIAHAMAIPHYSEGPTI